jgi:hypothetical protein
MPRDASGNFSLVAGNPVISGDVITSTWANSTMPDIADGLTNSLSRNGNGGMLVPLTFLDGTGGAPAIAFTNEPSLGTYRIGAGLMGFAAGGAAQVRVSDTNQSEVFRDAIWKRTADEPSVTAEIDTTVGTATADAIAAAVAANNLALYPVGSSKIGPDPAAVIGGTWVQLAEGTFLMNTVAAADPSGGSNDAVNIALGHTADAVPDHTHTVPRSTTGGNNAMTNSGASTTTSTLTSGDGGHTPVIQDAGVPGTDLNKPLYVGVEVWQRTA